VLYDLELFLAVCHLFLERGGEMVFDLERDLFGDPFGDLFFDLLLNVGSVIMLAISFGETDV